MKKVLVSLTVLAVAAMTAGPALAYGYSSGQKSVGNDGTMVSNSVYAESWTGSNTISSSQTQSGCFGGNNSSSNNENKITTGDATAYAGAANSVNSNVAVNSFGPAKQVSAGNDFTWVMNDVNALAVTGQNNITNSQTQKGFIGGNNSSSNNENKITTGDATAYAGAANLVNSNLALNTCCGPKKQVSAGNDGTWVMNTVSAGSGTGYNKISNGQTQSGCFGGSNSSNGNDNIITTGEATAAAGSITVVNTNIKRSFAW